MVEELEKEDKKMKVRLDKIHTPCERCFVKGIYYSPESLHCQRCEYNIAISFMRKILKINDNCSIDWKTICDEHGFEYIKERD